MCLQFRSFKMLVPMNVHNGSYAIIKYNKGTKVLIIWCYRYKYA